MIDPAREHRLWMILALLAGIGGVLMAVAIFGHLLLDGQHGPGLSVPHLHRGLDAIARRELGMLVGALVVGGWGWMRVAKVARAQAVERVWMLDRSPG